MKRNLKILKSMIAAAGLLAAFYFLVPLEIVRSQTPDDQLFREPAALSGSAEMILLGQNIFFDEDLSLNGNQSCASCHSPDWGFTGPASETNAHGAVYEGSTAGRFGNRKPPSAAYATLSPVFGLSEKGKERLFEGGNFWDGRATGERLGNPAAEQAQGPFLNPREQGLPDEACVVYRVRESLYGGLYKQVWGNNIDLIDFGPDIETLCEDEQSEFSYPLSVQAMIAQEYDNIGISIGVYEQAQNVYTSKFDASKRRGYKFTKIEQEGFRLFRGKGKCDNCHISRGKAPAFTDFTYDNLGVPKNPENPIYAEFPDFIDLGLGGFLSSRAEWQMFADDEFGKVKVPTLRNVDLRGDPAGVKAFMHNGVFKSLLEVVHFYNTRDVLPVCGGMTPRSSWGVTCWPEPEYPYSVNDDELGDLGLTQEEEAAIVEFLKTLSDGFVQ